MKKLVEDFKKDLYTEFEENKHKYKDFKEFIELKIFNLENDTKYEIDDLEYEEHKSLNKLITG